MTATARIELGPIERMRERGDQAVRGFARHQRIGIQRDDTDPRSTSRSPV
jgi:hypothetical protein